MDEGFFEVGQWDAKKVHQFVSDVLGRADGENGVSVLDQSYLYVSEGNQHVFYEKVVAHVMPATKLGLDISVPGFPWTADDKVVVFVHRIARRVNGSDAHALARKDDRPCARI